MTYAVYVPEATFTRLSLPPPTEDAVRLACVNLALKRFQQGFGYEPALAERTVRDELLAQRARLQKSIRAKAAEDFRQFTERISRAITTSVAQNNVMLFGNGVKTREPTNIG